MFNIMVKMMMYWTKESLLEMNLWHVYDIMNIKWIVPKLFNFFDFWG
jgi:hypothetical protein